MECPDRRATTLWEYIAKPSIQSDSERGRARIFGQLARACYPVAKWRALSGVGYFVVGLLLWVVHIWAFLIGITRFPVWWPVTANYGGRSETDRDRQEREQAAQCSVEE